MIKPILATGVEGIQKGLNGARQHAQEIASAGASSDAGFADFVQPLVALQGDLHQVQASAQVIRTVDEILTATLDATRQRNDR